MTPEALVAEQKKLEGTVWARAISTQEHFNQMILQVRNHLLTLVTAIVGAAALIFQKDIQITVGGHSMNVASFLFFAGLFIILAFYVTERGYHNLLVGAVKHAEALENELEPMVRGIKLTVSISKASKERILWMNLRSVWRIRLFYSILFALFLGAGLVIAQSAPTAVANDPSAGTKALKRFQQVGSYQYVMEEVVSLAENYVDANLANLDRTKAVAVFDIDETALSTWDILLSGEFTWDAARFQNFVANSKGKRIEPTYRLFQKLKSVGIPIVFVTSRAENLRDATVKNLQAEGFTGYSDLVMKPIGSTQSTKEFKEEARNRLRTSGKIIFLAIGDQPDDIEMSSKVGQFLLPNPFY